MTNLYYPKKAFKTLGCQKAGREFVKGLISSRVIVFFNAAVAKAN